MRVFFLLFLISLYYINCVLPFFNILSEKDPLSQEKNITYIYGHINPDTDAISSPIILADFLTKRGAKKTIIPCRLGEINKETAFALNFFNFSIPKKIDDPTEADQVILVDHNSPEQSIDFENANIVALIDHHAITGFYTNDPITIITKPLGCTCTILYELYKSNGIEISKDIAGLMVSAIISDTLLLKSPITTEEDINVVKNLSEYIDLDYEIYGRELLQAGCDVSDLTGDEIINLDSKFYEVNGYRMQIAFLNSVDVINFIHERKQEVLDSINNFVKNNNMQLFILVIVDIYDMDSTCLTGGEYTIAVEKAFNVTVVNNEVFLQGISSRKKEVYPGLAKAFNEMPEYHNDDQSDKYDSSHPSDTSEQKSYKENIRINQYLLIFILFYIII